MEKLNEILKFIIESELIIIDWSYDGINDELTTHVKKGQDVVFIRLDSDLEDIGRERFERSFNFELERRNK